MRVRTHPAVLVERRMAEVDCSNPDACHEWPGVRAKGGYGLVSPRIRFEPMERVTRVVLEKKLGRPLLPGMCACHTCDNPPCCNDRHLFEGTYRDNWEDSVQKGRWPVGERSRFAKLNNEQVRAIRKDERSNKEIAQDYDVQAEQVRRIRKGDRWQWLTTE